LSPSNASYSIPQPAEKAITLLLIHKANIFIYLGASATSSSLKNKKRNDYAYLFIPYRMWDVGHAMPEAPEPSQ
jgi:hypothetical protein